MSNPVCPECGCSRVYKNGLRYLANGNLVQRFLCRDCGFRFSDPNGNAKITCPTNSVISKIAVKDAESRAKSQRMAMLLLKKLEKQEPSVSGTEDAKGKIIEYCFYMKKKGYAEATIRLHRIALKVLAERKANLFNPETVKEVIAKQKWSENRKRNVINAYQSFLNFNRLSWDKPFCKARTQKIPFIPTEAEIDALISGTGKKLSTFLQLLKETAMRCGEAKRLQWIEVDFEKNIIRLNDPEKGSNPRMWKISLKLAAMLNALPRKSSRVFG
ncbi:MAG: tyrosine-type recombinase/integrase, partial [Candidatus Bilamarchaeaceae archaeon]